MKKKLLYSFMALFLFVGCTEKYNEQKGLYPTLTPRYLAVSKTNVDFPAEKGSENIKVSSLHTPWKIENAIEWITLSKTSGEADAYVNVGVSENTKAEEVRLGIFYLKANVEDLQFETPVSVTQAGAVPSISLSTSSIEFSGAGSSQTVEIEANCEYKISTTETWLTAVSTGNVLSISVLPNETRNYRNGVVSVSYLGNNPVTKTVSVRQAPAAISASTETLEVDNGAVEVEITITSECNWTANSSDGWIEVSPSAGNAGTSIINVLIAPNPSINERFGYVLIYIGDNECIKIPVLQKGIFLEVEKDRLDFVAGEGTQKLPVSSNTFWTVVSCPDWITVDPANGSGSMEISVTATENPNTTTRQGKFYIIQEGLSLSCEVDVWQNGKTFEVASNVLYFNDKASAQSLYVESDGTWNVETHSNWISVSPVHATGCDSLKVSVTDNIEYNERQGTVDIKLGDKITTIDVVQQGKYFTVETLTFPSKGGSLAISVSSNDEWTANVENETPWLELSHTGGVGYVNLIATAADNPSVNGRTATILIETAHKGTRIMVSQNARYLTADTREVLFYYEGGTSRPITISTDGAYKITTSDTWLSVRENDNQLTVTATLNGGFTRTGMIMIELTDLEEGSYTLTIPVKQLNYGGSFLRYDYDDDENYDENNTSDCSLTIIGYGNDHNFDNPLPSDVSLRITGYKSDNDWNSSNASSAPVTVTGYPSDRSYDASVSNKEQRKEVENGNDLKQKKSKR